MVALFIHLVVGAIVLTVSIENIKATEERKDLAKFYRVFNSVNKEIELNYSNCEVKDELLICDKVINYNENTQSDLLTTGIFEMGDGNKENNYISISIVDDEMYKMKIKVSGVYKQRQIPNEVETIFIKNIWEN